MEERQKEPFTTLDLTQVPTGLLMDRTLWYIDFSVLDGHQMVDAIRLSSRDYPYAYAMLHIADVDSSELSNVDVMFKLPRIWEQEDTIQLGALVYEYGRIKPYVMDRKTYG